MTLWIIIASFAASFLVVLAVLVGRRLRGQTVSDRDWEELLLLTILGGHAAMGRGQDCPDEREACQRSLDLRTFGAACVASGALPGTVEAEDVLTAAHERLMVRGAATRLLPPDGMPAGSLPPTHVLVLTPRGAREAVAIWERERARVARDKMAAHLEV